MSGVPTQRPTPSPSPEDNETLSFSLELYEESLKDELWDFDHTKKLLEVVRSIGTSWDDVSRVLNRESAECDKRYQQVMETLSPKERRRKLSGDVGQSDPETPNKKRRRRTAAEIERSFKCDGPDCNKAYGSEGALKMHIKLKHPGVSSTCPPPSPGIVHGSPRFPSRNPEFITPQLSSSAPVISSSHPVPNEQAHTPIGARYSDIPLLVMSIGSWQKRSMFCGDTMARFSYEERKFVWEVYHFNTLFARMEVPFDTVTSIGYEPYQENIVKLTVEVNSPPSFFEGIIQAHKPTTWRPINNDFTGGEASSNRKHILHLLKLSVNQPLEHLLEVEPRFQQILKTCVPLKDGNTNTGMCSSSVNPTTFTQPVKPASSVNIAPGPSYLIPSSTAPYHSITNTVLSDMYPGSSAVPPLVTDTEDSSSGASEHFPYYTSSDDEQDAEHTHNKQQHSELVEGVRRCQCVGGCSTPNCLCFKNLASCGGDCGCSDCVNPLNEEADLSSSSPSSPSPLIFFPPSFLAPFSPSTFTSPNTTSSPCDVALSLLPTGCEYIQYNSAQVNTIW